MNKSATKFLALVLLCAISNSQTPQTTDGSGNNNARLTTTSAPASPTCNCPQNLRTGICASDGNIYANLCRAHCTDASLTQFFQCGFNDSVACGQQCKKAVQCIGSCPQYFVQQSVCASDGNLYVDECRAQCVKSSNYQVFACKDQSDDVCSAACSKSYSKLQCESSCPKYIRFTLGCASNGKLYTDQCTAQCDDSSLKLLFDCGYPVNQDSCQTKCTAQVSSSNNSCSQCANQAKQPVCGNDGKVYDNKCLATCAKVNTVYDVSGNNDSSAQTACKNYNSVVVCQKACATSNNRSVCASDGYVYGSSCIAQCGGLKIVRNCGDSILSCFRNCKSNN